MDPDEIRELRPIDESRIVRAIPGCERYLLALCKAPLLPRGPRVDEQAAEEESERIDRMRSYWEARYEEWGKGFNRQVDHLCPRDYKELDAATALDIAAEKRAVDREIAAIERQLGQEQKPEPIQDLSAERKRHQEMAAERTRLEERTTELGAAVDSLDTSYQSQWLLKPKQILDICEGVKPDDPGRDIL